MAFGSTKIVNVRAGGVTINGDFVAGRNIVINGDKVVVDGVEQTIESKQINIVINGDVEQIETEYGDVQANNVSVIKTISGDVRAEHVKGSVQTVSGDVMTQYVGGSVKTVSGDIGKGLR